MGHQKKVFKGWVIKRKVSKGWIIEKKVSKWLAIEKKVSKGWVIEWWQFAGTTDPLTRLARNSNLPLDTSNNTKRSDRRQIAMRQVFLLLSWKRNQMCIWNLQGEGCWACCTLYIELSTHALTLRSIITIKNSFTILTKTKRNSLLKTSQELEGSFKTQFSSFQSAMFGCRGGLRLRILSWHSPNCCLCFTWRKKLYNTFKGKTRKRQSMLKTSYNIITSCQHKKSKHRIECNNLKKLQMCHDCVLRSIVCYQQHGCKGMRVSV